MASSTDIANSALTKLGENRITSLDDDVKAAREVKAVFDLRRDKLLRTYNWSFAMKRASLEVLASEPDWGYAYEYQLPSDFLRMVQVDDYYVIPGFGDYLTGPDSEPYRIEGRVIRTDIGAPLKVRYIRRVTNSGEFDAAFTEAFAYDLAHEVCESITGSTSKKQELRDNRMQEILEAIRANAIELPPQTIPDDSWVMSRL